MITIDNNRMLTYKNLWLIGILLPMIIGCNNNNDRADAYGNFEVEETTISAQGAGELLWFDVEEGDQLKPNQLIGIIDTTTLIIQKNELFANINSVRVNKLSIASEQKVMEAELTNLKRERNRISRLVESNAATQKQLDDIDGGITVLKSKMEALKSQYAIINAKIKALETKIQLIDEQLSRCYIKNPQEGMILTKLARAHEIVAPGKPLYKIADMNKLYLKAYISETQLSSIKHGQQVTVSFDHQDALKEIPGTISWVSSESEFTPKIIQTKEERVNLVYAIKVTVENDGFIKLGMPGEIHF